MRQIFTSPRLENVEGVARLLDEHGIETWISEGRSYKGMRRREFSYRDSGRSAQPAVWIVKAEDQTRARELLRAAGLIDSTRATDSFLPGPFQPPPRATTPASAIALRIKLVLLAAIAGAGGLILFRVFGA